MPDELRLIAAFATALLVAGLATGLARAIASRIDFYDHPVGFKRHRSPTPYLGGLGVVVGWLVAAGLFAAAVPSYGWLTLCACVLFAIGTLDDRIGLPIAPRLIAEGLAALVLWATGQGWVLFDSEAANLAVTIVWVIGLTNAFNLMDNLDGAGATVGAVSAAGVCGIALLHSDVMLAALALALCGACAGFLPHNLARPSRIFLGDGGSMPIGFIIAGAIMIAPLGDLGWSALPTYGLLVALPIFDTLLVSLSRYRRRRPILQGGRDHLTHRMLGVVRSERFVALVLGSAQALMCTLAVLLSSSSDAAALLGTSLVVIGGFVIIAMEAQHPAAMRVDETSSA